MAEKIKVVVKWPYEKYGHSTWISPTLKNLQKYVDGHIEYFQISTDMVAIVNEEGRINDLVYNCTICGMPLYGTVIFAGLDEDNEEHGLKNIPIDYQTFKKLFFSPEGENGWM